MEGTGGAIVGCDLMKEEGKDDCLSARIRSLRDTFRFELDPNEMELIGELVALPESASGGYPDERDEDLDLKSMMSNSKLWL